MSFRFIDHTADAAAEIRVTREEFLFEEAARVLNELYVDDASNLRPSRWESLTLEAEDRESLLVDFVNELIFHFDTRHEFAVSVEVETFESSDSTTQIVAKLGFIEFDKNRHRIRSEVKAATFHHMAIERTAEGWSTLLVFDL